MSWRESLLDASFKGVVFDCVAVRDTDERDVGVYVYPYRDGGELDDLGNGVTQIDVEAVFFGDDYETRLQRFLQVLAERGPGELIHPVFGSFPRAQVKGKAVDHEAERPDYAVVRVTFLSGEEENPFFSRTLPAGRADAASSFASVAQELGAQQFTDYLSSLKAAPGMLTRLNAIRDVMGGVLSGVRGLVDSYVTAATDLVAFPRTFVSDLASGLASLADLRSLTGDNLMPDWDAISDAFGDVVLLPEGLSTGSSPARFAQASPSATPRIAAHPTDVRAITTATRLTVAAQLVDAAAAILADQAETPTLSPADVETIAADVREVLQAAIDDQRGIENGAHDAAAAADGADLVVARPICEALRESAAAVQDAAASVINLLPPLTTRGVESRGDARRGQAALGGQGRDTPRGGGRIGRAEIADDADVVAQAVAQHRAHQVVQQGLVARLGVLVAGQLRQRQRALGQRFENQCAAAARGQRAHHRRGAIGAVAGKTGRASDQAGRGRGGHGGRLPGAWRLCRLGWPHYRQRVLIRKIEI